MKNAVIQFPGVKKKPAKTKKVRRLDPPKYLDEKSVKLLRRTARDQAILALAKKRTTAITKWAIIDLLTSTGLRAFEAAGLRVGHLELDRRKIFVFGKGRTECHIVIPDSLAKHLRAFLKWKKANGQPVEDDSPLFQGQRGQLTAQGISEIVKGFLRPLGLYRKGMASHCLRHSYATELLRKTRNIALVSRALRHASISTTQIYAHVLDGDMDEAVRGLWG